MLDFLWQGTKKPAPQVPVEETGAPSESAAPGVSEKTALPSEFNRAAVFEQGQCADGLMASFGTSPTGDEPPIELGFRLADEDQGEPAKPLLTEARARDDVALGFRVADEDQGEPAKPLLAGARAADDVAVGFRVADEDQGEAATPLLAGRRRGRRLVKREAEPGPALTAEQRLLLLDTWRRSGLPARDFAAMVGISRHTLYSWKQKFDKLGPGGLVEQPRGGSKGSRLPELTKRTILMMKAANPEWGCQRISDLLTRGPALPASASAVARVLHEAGYELEEVATRPHPDKVRHFERAKPNQLWQTDLFTFVLKRQNRRVYLVAFMDDHSRFIVGYGLHASQSTALVLEVLRAAITSYGNPEEILTDNGSQYVTWRGKSQFSKELEKRGIKQVVAAPRRPQTLGKIERFWGTLWRECIES